LIIIMQRRNGYRNMQFVMSKIFNLMEFAVYLIRKRKERYFQCQLDSLRSWKATLLWCCLSVQPRVRVGWWGRTT